MTVSLEAVLTAVAYAIPDHPETREAVSKAITELFTRAAPWQPEFVSKLGKWHVRNMVTGSLWMRSGGIRAACPCVYTFKDSAQRMADQLNEDEAKRKR